MGRAIGLPLLATPCCNALEIKTNELARRDICHPPGRWCLEGTIDGKILAYYHCLRNMGHQHCFGGQLSGPTGQGHRRLFVGTSTGILHYLGYRSDNLVRVTNTSADTRLC